MDSASAMTLINMDQYQQVDMSNSTYLYNNYGSMPSTSHQVQVATPTANHVEYNYDTSLANVYYPSSYTSQLQQLSAHHAAIQSYQYYTNSSANNYVQNLYDASAAALPCCNVQTNPVQPLSPSSCSVDSQMSQGYSNPPSPPDTRMQQMTPTYDHYNYDNVPYTTNVASNWPNMHYSMPASSPEYPSVSWPTTSVLVLNKPGGRKCTRCQCPNCTVEGGNNNYGADGKRLHICHYANCGKVYGKTSHLKAHLRGHAGQRPYFCKWLDCGKRFTRSDELQRHNRIHTGERKFKCPHCVKRFTRSDHLSKHVRTHENPKKRGAKKNDLAQNDLAQEFVMITDIPSV